jgi:hypothetical protein
VKKLNKNTIPHISVLMSVHNAENSINFAIESIFCKMCSKESESINEEKDTATCEINKYFIF